LNRSIVNVTSLYIQDQIELIPQLQAIVGVRYDMFEVDFRQRNGPRDHLISKDDLIAPRYGLIYKPIESVSFYASYSQAYVPRAGDQLTSLNVTIETLKPEKFTTRKPGVNGISVLIWLLLPLCISWIAVTSSIRLSEGRLFLTKGQRTEGVEVSLAGQLASNWSVMGGYAYQTG